MATQQAWWDTRRQTEERHRASSGRQVEGRRAPVPPPPPRTRPRSRTPARRSAAHLHRAKRGGRVGVARHHGGRQLAQRGRVPRLRPARGAPAGQVLLVHGASQHVRQQLRDHLVAVVVGVGAAGGRGAGGHFAGNLGAVQGPCSEAPRCEAGRRGQRQREGSESQGPATLP
jgi:hypothetical protein